MTLVPAIISEENLGGGASLTDLFSRLQVVKIFGVSMCISVYKP